MLCKIDATIGTTDAQARAINFMRAVTAVMTAASGSTPTCNVLVSPNIYNDAYNIVTEVVANTTDGGWTLTANSNVVGNYNTSFSSYYQSDFVSNVQTGKSSYPYLKCTLATNTFYAFSAFATNPNMDFRIGFNNSPFYSNTYAQAMTVANVTANVITSWASDNSVSNNAFPAIRPNYGEYLVASTSNYIAFLTANAVTYFGYRTTQAWEDAKTDNPPVVAFSTPTQGYGNYTAAYFFNGANNYTATNYCAWLYTQDVNAVTSASPRWMRNFYVSALNGTASATYNPTSGTCVNATITSPVYFSPAQMIAAGKLQHGIELASPLLQLRTHAVTYWQQTVTDPLSNVQIPPAIPINFWCANVGNVNSGGSAIGIYKSLSADDRYLANVWAPGTSYIVNGDPYYSYRTGYYIAARDIFLVKKV